MTFRTDDAYLYFTSLFPSRYILVSYTKNVDNEKQHTEKKQHTVDTRKHSVCVYVSFKYLGHHFSEDVQKSSSIFNEYSTS